MLKSGSGEPNLAGGNNTLLCLEVRSPAGELLSGREVWEACCDTKSMSVGHIPSAAPPVKRAGANAGPLIAAGPPIFPFGWEGSEKGSLLS